MYGILNCRESTSPETS